MPKCCLSAGLAMRLIGSLALAIAFLTAGSLQAQESGALPGWQDKLPQLTDPRDRMAVDVVDRLDSRPAIADALEQTIAAYNTARKPTEPRIVYHRLEEALTLESCTDFYHACGYPESVPNAGSSPGNRVHLIDKDLKYRGTLGYAPFTAKGWCADAIAFSAKVVDPVQRATLCDTLGVVDHDIQVVCNQINGYSKDARSVDVVQRPFAEFCTPKLDQTLVALIQNSPSALKPFPAGAEPALGGGLVCAQVGDHLLAQDIEGKRKLVLTSVGGDWRVASFSGYGFELK